MKTETAAHTTERVKRATQPVYFIRFYDVPTYGLEPSTPFTRDLSSGPVLAPTVPKLECIESISGGEQRVTPEQGQATIGGFRATLVDRDGEILKHFAGITPGQHIRPGQRCRLYSGYASMDEDEYLEHPLVEVVDRSLPQLISTAFVLETADITRALRREVFLTATPDVPFIIGGHPITIALQVMLSTGTGTNGPYDVLAAVNGLGIPQAFIDVTGFELERAAFPLDGYCFTITAPENGKEWLEREIFKTINGYPLVRQSGALGLKVYTPVIT